MAFDDGLTDRVASVERRTPVAKANRLGNSRNRRNLAEVVQGFKSHNGNASQENQVENLILAKSKNRPKSPVRIFIGLRLDSLLQFGDLRLQPDGLLLPDTPPEAQGSYGTGMQGKQFAKTKQVGYHLFTTGFGFWGVFSHV